MDPNPGPYTADHTLDAHSWRRGTVTTTSPSPGPGGRRNKRSNSSRRLPLVTAYDAGRLGVLSGQLMVISWVRHGRGVLVRRAAALVTGPGRGGCPVSTHFSSMMLFVCRSSLARRTILTWCSEAENHHSISIRKPAKVDETPASIINVGQASRPPRPGHGLPLESGSPASLSISSPPGWPCPLKDVVAPSLFQASLRPIKKISPHIS